MVRTQQNGYARQVCVQFIHGHHHRAETRSKGSLQSTPNTALGGASNPQAGVDCTVTKSTSAACLPLRLFVGTPADGDCAEPGVCGGVPGLLG
jgi:hypothetical protein